MTELIWEGKYDSEGRRTAPLRVSLPFQTVETVNESARERQLSLERFQAGRDPEWRNRLIWGDKKYVLPSLLEEFAGEVDLIYIDPPFDTGADFSFQVQIDGESFTKEPSIIEMKAYRDTWGVSPEERASGKTHLDKYLQWFYDTLVLLKDLLAEDGAIYVQLDQHVVHYAKAALDEVFGVDNFGAEIIWKRATKLTNLKNYGVEHDSVLFYSQTSDFVFNQQYKPLKEQDVLSKYVFLELPDGSVTRLTKAQRLNLTPTPAGRRFRGVPITNMNPNRPNLKYEFKGMVKVWAITREKMLELESVGVIFQENPGGLPMRKQYLDEVEGAKCNDVWEDIPPVNSQALERTGYNTQKPEALLERIIRTSSNEGDLVLDCFVGSGTAAVVAEKLNRRWIAADLGRFAIHTTRKRLLGIPNVRPFVVQNLGKYERQVWQAAEFGEQAEAKQAAYRRFILELYKARPIAGYTWLHGVKAGRMVHVGAVDSPISPGDVSQIAAEFRRAVGTGKDAPTINGVDVLGWDFAFELNEVARQQAALANIDMRFRRIPRDVMDKRAVEQGDVHFFELGALSLDVHQQGRATTLTLTDFVIPPDDVPEDVQRAITHWEQWIDYWAVDWDNKGDTFHNQWQDYRTRKKRTIQKSVSHTYDEPGTYTLVVKVIDILGNDTTKAIKVEVRADGPTKKSPARTAQPTATPR